jgi:hypothetical protein
MNNRIITIFMVLFVVAISTVILGYEPFSIHDFSGGLNTVDNVRYVPDNQAQRLQNWLLNETGHSMSVRPGYHPVTDSIDDYNRIWGIYGQKFSDGGGVLFQVLDRDDTCWSDLYISNVFSYTADDSIDSHIYANKPRWLNWMGNIYLFNGKNIPKIIFDIPDDPLVLDIVPQAPGEVQLTPMASACGFHGEVIYAISSLPEGGSFDDAVCTYIPDPFLVDSEKVLISGFFRRYVKGSQKDSTHIRICKTKPNRTDPLDSFFIINDYYNLSSADLDTFNIIESHNGNFYPMDFWREIYLAQRMGLKGYAGYDIMGAPAIMNIDSTSSTTNYVLEINEYKAVKYKILFLDTASLAISDTSLDCMYLDSVFFPSTDTVFAITIWIPPTINERYLRVIYRSAASGEWSDLTWTDWYCLDTVWNSSDTSYFDSKNQDSIMVKNAVYSGFVIRKRFHGAVIHEARMVGWDDHTIYLSETGTSGQWSVFDQYGFDTDDGDRIINVSSHEGYLIVHLTKSIYIVYTTDGFVTHSIKKTQGVGQIAPFSMDNYNGANIFLGKKGVTFENANIYLDRSLTRDNFSRQIKNLIVRDLSQMASAVGVTVGDIWLMSYPGTDSCFAFFFETNAWSPWNFDFSDACLYDTSETAEYGPFNQLIFVQDDDERIFVWDDADTTDNGQDYQAIYKKTFWAPTFERIIPDKLHLWKSIQVPDGDSLIITLTDENGDTLSSFGIDSLSNIYDCINIAVDNNKSAHYINVEIIAPNRSNLTIDGLDLEIKGVGPDKVRSIQ